MSEQAVKRRVLICVAYVRADGKSSASTCFRP